jgi:chromosome segregation ATPase
MTSGNPAQGRRQIHLGVTTLAWLNIYQTLKQIVQDAIAPELQSIKGDIKALDARIDSLDTKIDSLDTKIEAVRQELRAVESRVDQRFDEVNRRFDEQGRQWQLAMEVRERLASLEAQLKAR